MAITLTLFCLLWQVHGKPLFPGEQQFFSMLWVLSCTQYLLHLNWNLVQL